MDTSWFDEFYAEGLVTEVLAQLKSGKEATVFLCRATGPERSGLVAIKTYHGRQRRDFHNRSDYLHGMVIPGRVGRAVENRSDFGKVVLESIWINREFDTLCTLHAAGADVPEPFAASGRSIAMQCIGDEGEAGVQLRSVQLTTAQARRYLERLLWNIERMLACNLVHADLSPYNILVWNDRPWIIDLPQAVDPRRNENACQFLFRDVARVCSHFRRYDVEMDSTSFADSLWQRYQRAAL